MSGNPAFEIISDLQHLPGDERQSLLCTVCSMHNEIACNCRDHGKEVSKLLTLECPLFVDGRATCLLEDFSN
jgi:hypothetical protein